MSEDMAAWFKFVRDIAAWLADEEALAGRMDTELTVARLAYELMLAAVRRNAPSAATVNQGMTGKQLVSRYAIAAVDLEMDLAGGAGFYRAAGLERRLRDIQEELRYTMSS